MGVFDEIADAGDGNEKDAETGATF